MTSSAFLGIIDRRRTDRRSRRSRPRRRRTATLKHRTLRLLVEQLGFRTVAWEEDWTTGVETTVHPDGDPDLTPSSREMSPQWPTSEVADVLPGCATTTPGDRQVSFFGVEYYFTGGSPTTRRGVLAAVAPDLLRELRQHLDPIRPFRRPVRARPDVHGPGRRQAAIHRNAHATSIWSRAWRRPTRAQIALHQRQIVSFHEHYDLTADDARVPGGAGRPERGLVAGLTGDRVAYWAASPHTVNARSCASSRRKTRSCASRAPAHSCGLVRPGDTCRSGTRSTMAR